MVRSHKQQQSMRQFFLSRGFLIVALFLAVVIAFGFARAYYKDYRVRQEIRQLESEVADLEKKKFQSIELLEYVTSKDFVEEKARTELNLKRPGEYVAFIKNSQHDRTEAVSEDVDEAPLSNPVKWWYYFIHKSI